MTAHAPLRLRLVYLGTAPFAAPSLRALAASHHDLVAVYTQPARPAGRGMRPRLSAVGAAALEFGLPLCTPARLKDAAEQEAFRGWRADLAIVAAYGLILPPAILDAPRLGCINLHASLLPRWRGAAPIQRAILADDRETGVTVMQMAPGLDSGPILATAKVTIDPEITAQTLHDRLAALAAELVVPTIEQLANGTLRAVAQPEHGVTYAHKIEKGEGHIDWTRPAAEIERRLRAFNPWPGCWTEVNDQRLLLLAGTVTDGTGRPGEVLDQQLTVATGDRALRITRLQRAGGKPMAAEAFLRGHPIPVGNRLGEPCPVTS